MSSGIRFAFFLFYLKFILKIEFCQQWVSKIGCDGVPLEDAGLGALVAVGLGALVTVGSGTLVTSGSGTLVTSGKIRQFPPSAQNRPPFRVFLPLLHLFELISGLICIDILPFIKMSNFGRLKFQCFRRANFCHFFTVPFFLLLKAPGYTKHPSTEATLRVNVIFRTERRACRRCADGMLCRNQLGIPLIMGILNILT